jgi:hypothetical protein
MHHLHGGIINQLPVFTFICSLSVSIFLTKFKHLLFYSSHLAPSPSPHHLPQLPKPSASPYPSSTSPSTTEPRRLFLPPPVSSSSPPPTSTSPPSVASVSLPPVGPALPQKFGLPQLAGDLPLCIELSIELRAV